MPRRLQVSDQAANYSSSVSDVGEAGREAPAMKNRPLKAAGFIFEMQADFQWPAGAEKPCE